MVRDSLASQYAALAQRILAGDSQAEEELCSLLKRSIFTMLRLRTGEVQHAEDLTHDVLIRLIEKLRSEALDDPTQVAAYAHGIAKMMLTNDIRKQQRRNTHADSPTIELFITDSNQQELVLERSKASAYVRKLIAELRVQRDREILHRSYILEQDKSTVCESLGMDSTQFDRVISRARQRFRAIAIDHKDVLNL